MMIIHQNVIDITLFIQNQEPKQRSVILYLKAEIIRMNKQM